MEKLNLILRWLIVIVYLIFYISLIVLCGYGLIISGIKNIPINIFFFVLLGLFCLPLIINFIPSLETLKIFGVEFIIEKKLEETEKYLKEFPMRKSKMRFLNLLMKIV